MIYRYNEIRDELVNLASRALNPPSAVLRDEPLIHGRANENVKTSPAPNSPARVSIKKLPQDKTNEATYLFEDSRQLEPTVFCWMFVSADTDATSYCCKRTRPKC